MPASGACVSRHWPGLPREFGGLWNYCGLHRNAAAHAQELARAVALSTGALRVTGNSTRNLVFRRFPRYSCCAIVISARWDGLGFPRWLSSSTPARAGEMARWRGRFGRLAWLRFVIACFMGTDKSVRRCRCAVSELRPDSPLESAVNFPIAQRGEPRPQRASQMAAGHEWSAEDSPSHIHPRNIRSANLSSRLEWGRACQPDVIGRDNRYGHPVLIPYSALAAARLDICPIPRCCRDALECLGGSNSDLS